MSIKVKAIERNVSFDKSNEKWAYVMQADLYSKLSQSKVGSSLITTFVSTKEMNLGHFFSNFTLLSRINSRKAQKLANIS